MGGLRISPPNWLKRGGAQGSRPATCLSGFDSAQPDVTYEVNGSEVTLSLSKGLLKRGFDKLSLTCHGGVATIELDSVCT